MVKSVIISLLIMLTACTGHTPLHPKASEVPSANVVQIDSNTQAFKINGSRFVLKRFLDMNTLVSAKKDTLDMAICGEYVYSPFGTINNKTDIISGKLKNFNLKERTDEEDSGPARFNILIHGQSKLIFFFDDDPEGEKQSPIIKGEIYDKDVQFDHGIRIGMDIQDLYSIFFEDLPGPSKTKFKVIVLESCVSGIKHIYTFDKDKLSSVKFITDTYWKVDY